MKSITIIIAQLILLSFSVEDSFGQSIISGQYSMNDTGIAMYFDSNQGIYQIQYANGVINSNYYSIIGNILQLQGFNNGIEQDFTIIENSGSRLVLETLYLNPVQRYVLVRGNNASINNYGTGYSNQVLASKDGYNFTEQYFENELRFIEFILGTQMTADDRAIGKLEAISEFEESPQKVLTEIDNVNTQMQQLYMLSDIGQIALARSMMLAQIYPELQKLSPEVYFLKMIEKYTPVVAINSDLALTQRDLDGYIIVMELNAMKSGQQFSLSLQERQQYYMYLLSEFETGNIESKQSLCMMGLYSEYLQLSFSQMTPEQFQEYSGNYNDGSIASSDWESFNQGLSQTYELEGFPPDVNTKEEKQAYLRQYRNKMKSNSTLFNIMQDVNIHNDVMWNNIIEDWGDSGNYWEVKYNDY